MPKSTLVKCPVCDRENDFNADPLGPFCSTRCKMVDLGKWFTEDYRFSDPLHPDHFAEPEDLEDHASGQTDPGA